MECTCSQMVHNTMVYAYPCGACAMPTSSETTINNFKFNQSECLQPQLPNTITPNDMMVSTFLSNLSIVYYTFYGHSGTIVNSTRATANNLLGYGGVTFTRLIRKIRVA